MGKRRAYDTSRVYKYLVISSRIGKGTARGGQVARQPRRTEISVSTTGAETTFMMDEIRNEARGCHRVSH